MPNVADELSRVVRDIERDTNSSEGAEGEREMTGPKGVGRRWTPAEERQLRDLLDAGMTAAKVATKLGRTRQAIYARLQHIYRKRNKTKVGNVRGPD